MSNSVNITILSNGYLSNSKSILFVSNNERYLINCGEGTQKIFIENGKKLGALKNIFITKKSQQNMCGLIGVALGINNSKNIELNLHGFEKSIDIIKASKKFADEETCKIIYNNGTIFEDKAFKVLSFNYQSVGDSINDECVGYLFSTTKVRPKINLVKCEAFGVPRNVIKSKKMGEFLQQTHVTLEDGRIIQSSDVLDAPLPAEKFLVFECPSTDHVANLINSLPLHNLRDEQGYVTTVFHLTDKSIVDQHSYQLLIKRINSIFTDIPTPKHIIIDSQSLFPLSYSTYFLQTCLNYFFDDHIFPKLKLYEDYIANNNSRNDSVVTVDNNDSLATVAEPFMTYNLNNISDSKENTNEMWSRLKFLNEQDIIKEILHNNDFFLPECMMEKMLNLKNELLVKKNSLKDEYSYEYPNVTFIGTSSSTPSKYRNISSILLEPKADVFVLFDCGEGSLDRILMLHGLERGRDIIRNIRLICITHHHLDHHSGLYNILRYRQMIGDCKPCLVLAALNVQLYTAEMDSIFETHHCAYSIEWCRIDLLQIENNSFATDYPRTAIDNFELELAIQISPVRVYHTATSYGFVLSGTKYGSSEPWKITYSGDRWPKYEGLVREGLDSDILIHEATMDDGLEEMAARKYHSTVSQAIEEGVKMRAKFTMLTHFSSRHPLVPPVECKHSNVAQAYDFMKVDLRSCHYLKVLDPYLEYLFPRHWQALVTERLKRLKDLETDQSPRHKKRKMDT